MQNSTHVKDDQLLTTFEEFYEAYYQEEIAELAQKFPSDEKSLVIDYQDVYRFDVDVADDLLSKPKQLLEYAEEALRLYELPADVSLAGANVRVVNLPSQHQHSIDETRADHRGRYISLHGLVQKSSDVKPKVVEAAFECERCGTLSRIPQTEGDLQEPHECGGCERQGPFRINFDQSELIDHQLLRLQQPPGETSGAQGETIDVVLEDDIADVISPGDRIHALGIHKLEREKNEKNRDTVFETYLDGCAIEKQEQQFEEIDFSEYEEQIKAIADGEYGNPIDAMVDSIAPGLYGMDVEKRAALLQLFGGTKANLPDGSTIRGDFHVLLLGDPGCGKSSLLDAIKEIAPRATKASGKGATAAGMTAAAVRDDFGATEWGIEAGALVMADGGMACVDEIDKVNDDAVSSLHNALEAQEVEISKAGINATLSAETSLLAAGNPKYGRFDQHEPIGEQIDLAPSLMSRFDLIFTMSEQPDREEDGDLAKHMLQTKRAGKFYEQDDETNLTDTVELAIEPDVLRAYIAFARQKIDPHIPQELDDKVVNWFVEFRQAGDDIDSPVPVTARKVEAIERLAEAHARARLSNTVSEADLKAATHLVEQSLRNVGLDPETGEFDADIIETGTSKSQRDRVRLILDIISDKQSDFDDGVPLEIIVQEAMDHGCGKSETEHMVENDLKEKGKVYSPKNNGQYRTTENM